jgi:glycosyltransferase involved in cell wall biosynthesis
MTQLDAPVTGQQILVLVPHEPTLDPRIHYTAASLARHHAVAVVATVHETEVRSADNDPRDAAYTTVRIPYHKAIAFGMLWAYVSIWAALSVERARYAGVLRVAMVGLGAALFLPILLSLLVLGILFETVLVLVLMPVYVLRFTLDFGPFFLLRPLLRAAWQLPKRCIAAVWSPARRSFEQLTIGSRVALSVFRFTFQANRLLLRYVDEHHVRPDAIYCHDLYSLQAGVSLKRKYGARLIYDSHEYYPYQYQFPIFSWLVRCYEACLVNAVDAYITVTPQLADELAKVYGAASVHCIPNVEPRPPIRLEPVVSKMSELARGRLKLLYQGQFAEGRGLEEVLREWRDVDGSKIALFLRGPKTDWRDRLEGLASELGLLGESVYLLAPVLERDLIGGAQEADIGLIPYKGDWLSYRFAGPNKLSQYIHAGLAIVGNNLPYVEQVIEHGKCGVCYDVSTKGSLAKTAGALASDRGLVERFKKNALAFSHGEYNWERYEPLLLKLVTGTKLAWLIVGGWTACL